MKEQKIIQNNELNSGNFFYPRVIREFNDDDEPMMYGEQWWNTNRIWLTSFARATSNLPILFSFRRCPYAIRARMTIVYSGLSVELREVLLARKPPSMTAASSKGTVPILMLPDGRVVDESYDVMRWALDHHDHYKYSDHFPAKSKTPIGRRTHVLRRGDFPLCPPVCLCW